MKSQMRRNVFWTALIVLAASLLLFSFTLTAQVDTGSIAGTVMDASGAVVPGATVTLINDSTGRQFTASTNSVGNYQFPALQIGAYSISVEAQGFGKQTHEHLQLNIQQRLEARFTLQPLGVTEAVNVTGIADQLQTQETSVGAVVTKQAINDLPLNGRNYTFLAQLNAGVVPGTIDTRGLSQSGSFSANGAGIEQNNYLLDGIDNNSNLADYLNGSSYTYRPSVDALHEFKVQISIFSEEFGRSAGAVLNASIKSGTNKFHGDAYEFLRNSALDAANFFENSNSLGKGEFRRNQFGATLGGPVPILKFGKNNKTFFFVDYEGTRMRQASVYLQTVPTPLMVSSGYTNLSDLIKYQSGTRTDALGRVTAVGQVSDPASTRAVTAGQVDPGTGLVAKSTGYVRDPFPGNIIPASRFDPNAIKLLSLYPAATGSGFTANYSRSVIVQGQNDQGDFRIDRYVTSKDTVSVRFSKGQDQTLFPQPFPAQYADGAPFSNNNSTNKYAMVMANWTRIMSSSFVNELRVGNTHLYSARVSPFNGKAGIPSQFGIQGVNQPPGWGGLSYIQMTGLSNLGTAQFIPCWETGDTLDISDTATKLAGRHSIKFGFDLKFADITFLQPQAPFGAFTFSGAFTEVPSTTGGNTGIAQMLLTPLAPNYVGGPSTVNVSNIATPTPEAKWPTLSGFIEDTWKVNQKLTVILGLRYDLQNNPYVPGGYGANFVMGAKPTIWMGHDQCMKGLSPSYLELTAKDGISIACAGDNVLTSSSYTGFAPRVGIAYQFLPKWVIRAGFGRFFGTTPQNIVRYIAQNYPLSYSIQYVNNDPGHPIQYPNGTTATLESGLAPLPVNNSALVNAANLVVQGQENPMLVPETLQYNFVVQNQLTASQSLSIGYLGNGGRHLKTGAAYNSVREVLPPGLNSKLYIPFPDFATGSMGVSTEWGTSSYNALQVSYERRFSGGLAVLANYTWSKCFSTARAITTNNVGSVRAELVPGFGLRPDRALCDDDVTNVFHVSWTYDLPFGHGNRFMAGASPVLNGLVGGWQMNAVTTLEGGQPFTIGCPISTTTGLGCNAFIVPGQNPYSGPHNVDHWLNPAYFSQPPAATKIGQTDFTPLGGAPTQVRSPGYHRMDFSVFKEFPIHETERLEFRAECFNLTNSPQFGIPGFMSALASSQSLAGVTDFTNTKNFGKITAVRDFANDQREIQFALKFYW